MSRSFAVPERMVEGLGDTRGRGWMDAAYRRRALQAARPGTKRKSAASPADSPSRREDNAQGAM
ncbi:MAG TPA: hypothetical protein EYP90_03220 [Chromatiaceae bacterium]|nr:hypothetical protein [Chromatiaceae bacterium]